jgi:bifunctional ADP-heptose synthase (sugar kinase/adenylyltransferase)
VLDQFEHKHVLVVGDVSRSTALSTGTLRTLAGGADDRDAIDVVGGPGNVARNVISLGSACEIVAVVRAATRRR